MHRVHEGLDSSLALAVEPAGPSGRGQQEQRLTEGVELELAVDVVAEPHGGARVAGELHPPLAGDGSAVDAVRRPQVRAVLEHPLGDEAHRSVEQVGASDGGGSLPGEALVADPGEPVVVVAAAVRPLGQRGGRGGDHAPVGAGEARSTA